MTREELLALVEILNRIPVSQGEKLFLADLIRKLEAEILEKESANNGTNSGAN